MDGQEEKDKQQNNPAISFGDAATEPIDLSQAFKMLKNNDASQPENPVADPEEPAGEQQAGIEVDDTGAGAAVNPDVGAGYDTDGDSLGGSTTSVEPVDYDDVRKQALTEIQRQAIASVRKEFADQGIDNYSINELYQRDENTGQVIFINPDNERQPFTSRAEAQQWVDAFNKQVNDEFRSRINAKQRELIQQNAPKLRLIDFIPRYETMDDTSKEIFDDIIEPYEIRDGRGQVIGYNCDLNHAANQANKIAKRFNAGTQANNPADTQAAKGSSQPATDLPSGANTSGKAEEPKTIGEALKLYDKSKNKKGK